MSIIIIDTGTANITSVSNAFKYLGKNVVVSSDAEDIAKADKIVLPGVGAFSYAINALESKNIKDEIRNSVTKEEKPFLGICLGMQMLATVSMEGGEHGGLNLIPGRVVPLQPEQAGFRVPNVGWCNVEAVGENRLLKEDKSFYHIHSYYFQCENKEHVVGTINYSGNVIPVMVQDKNIFGVQFHPEKSHDGGLALLDKFTNI